MHSDSFHPFSRGRVGSEDDTPNLDPVAFEARLRTLPTRTIFSFPEPEVPSHFKHSSVLIAFWHDGSTVRTLMTKRAATLRTQPDQMSFPGGRLEAGESWIEGALRETEEEVGIPSAEIEVLGRLDDAWSGAGHRLVPIVGWLDRAPSLRLNPDEVASAHTPSIEALLPREVYQREPIELDGETFYNETLHWEDEYVFGLSTDLLIEAMRWGLGLPDRHGHERLRTLRAWLRMKASDPKSAR